MARSLARLGNNGFACMTSARETQQGFLGVGRNERAVFGQHVAAAEAATVRQLGTALELGHAIAGALLSGAPRRHRMKIKTREQIGPQIGHSLSVSRILR